jgi:pimeloyl-ACP methyl ester carboxylesterase
MWPRRWVVAAALSTVLLAPAAAAADTLPQPAVKPIVWGGCSGPDLDAFQCASLIVPRDYANPGAAVVKLAVMRKPATESAGKLESIAMNPGGPGGSGLEFLAGSVEDPSFRQLNRRHDLVSFDPRGVGKSTHARCAEGSTKFLEGDTSSPKITPETFKAPLVKFIAGCVKASGGLLPYLGTADVARDMEQLRVALGEAKLDYLGYSYGSFLGATYAALFPDSVGTMVIDGVDDPDEYANRPLDSDLEQATANQLELKRFLTYARHRKWVGRGSGLAGYRAIIKQLEKKPLRVRGVSGVKRLRAADVRNVVLELIAVRSTWKYLARDLRELSHGDGTDFAYLAKYLAATDDSLSLLGYLSNSGADRVADPATVNDAYAAKVTAASPDFGSDVWTATQANALWPHAAARFAGPWVYPASATRNPILVIGTRFDPRTPYSGAVAMRAQLGNAILLTFQGDGHTAFANGANDGCIDDKVIAYFNEGAQPDDGASCAAVPD